MSSGFWSGAADLVEALVLLWIIDAIWRRVHPRPPTAPPTESHARELARDGTQIAAMKMIRELRGIDLKAAKQWAEDVVAERTYEPSAVDESQ